MKRSTILFLVLLFAVAGVRAQNGNNNGQTKNKQSVSNYMKAAEAGDAEAMRDLGICYAYGEGVGQSYAEAVKWFRKAADLGDAAAMFSLGVCYAYGEGVGQSDAEAAKCGARLPTSGMPEPCIIWARATKTAAVCRNRPTRLLSGTKRLPDLETTMLNEYSMPTALVTKITFALLPL